MTAGACNTNGCLVTDDLSGNHSQRLALRGVDLSGHDTASWLILGQAQLTQATAGPGSEVSNIVCNLHERASNDVQGSVSLHESVMSSERFELVRSGLELDAGNLADFGSDLHVEAPLGVETLIHMGH